MKFIHDKCSKNGNELVKLINCHWNLASLNGTHLAMETFYKGKEYVLHMLLAEGAEITITTNMDTEWMLEQCEVLIYLQFKSIDEINVLYDELDFLEKKRPK